MHIYCSSVIMNSATFPVWAINYTVINLLTGKELVAKVFLSPGYLFLMGDQIYPCFTLCVHARVGTLISVW